MSLLISILLIATCLLLVLVILVQNPKGGGLSSTFGGGSSQMLGGVKKTNDFLDKATWTLSIVLVALVLIINLGGSMASDEVTNESGLVDQLNNAAPVAPATIPQAGGEELQDNGLQTVEETEQDGE